MTSLAYNISNESKNITDVKVRVKTVIKLITVFNTSKTKAEDACFVSSYSASKII